MSAPAKAIASAVAPEIAIPAEVLSSLVRKRPAPRSFELQGDVLLVPPAEKEKLIHWGKERIRVRTIKGIRIVTVERRPGLSLPELAIGAVGLAVGYELVKAYETNQASVSAWTGFLTGGKQPKNAQQAAYLQEILSPLSFLGL